MVNKDNNYILVVIDCYSKYIWAFPLKSKHTKNIIECLQKIFRLFSPPKILQSENGKEFKNTEMEAFCDENNVFLVHGRPSKPTTQGQVERSNGT